MPSIITIGNFDGVHRGHQAILQSARQLAAPQQAQVLAVTFDPMPVAVLRPSEGPPHLGTIDQRIAALRHAGADGVVVLKPTKDLLSHEAPRFIAGLIDQHQAIGFVEGNDFRFGAKRSGDMTMLAKMGREQGFAVEALPRVEVPLSDRSVAPISSSLVRWLIGRGRVEDAAACMGRPFELVGTIVKGEQRGRTIGVPTANLDPQSWDGLITPMDGVYAGSVTLAPGTDQDNTPQPAAISVGVKPTFGQDQLNIEAHLIDYTTEHPDALYGKPATFSFAHWVRDQYPFPGIEALTEQLRRDIDQCKNILAQPGPAYD
ncbi:MAG: riboflavin biosynthesis protein RibF [Phycisphaeraceae bacterium]|nr:riboflavin biosynthesis protein RibF [Phycisphaeraceae bacterium]